MTDKFPHGFLSGLSYIWFSFMFQGQSFMGQVLLKGCAAFCLPLQPTTCKSHCSMSVNALEGKPASLHDFTNREAQILALPFSCQLIDNIKLLNNIYLYVLYGSHQFSFFFFLGGEVGAIFNMFSYKRNMWFLKLHNKSRCPQIDVN